MARRLMVNSADKRRIPKNNEQSQFVQHMLAAAPRFIKKKKIKIETKK
jgi:hypothetical protein